MNPRIPKERYEFTSYGQIGNDPNDIHNDYYKISQTRDETVRCVDIAKSRTPHLRWAKNETIFSEIAVCNLLRAKAEEIGRNIDDIVECSTKVEQSKNGDIKYFDIDIEVKSTPWGVANLCIPVRVNGDEILWNRLFRYYAPVIHIGTEYYLPGIVEFSVREFKAQVPNLSNIRTTVPEGKQVTIYTDKNGEWELVQAKERDHHGSCVDKFFIKSYRPNNYGGSLITYDRFCSMSLKELREREVDMDILNELKAQLKAQGQAMQAMQAEIHALRAHPTLEQVGTAPLPGDMDLVREAFGASQDEEFLHSSPHTYVADRGIRSVDVYRGENRKSSIKMHSVQERKTDPKFAIIVECNCDGNKVTITLRKKFCLKKDGYEYADKVVPAMNRLGIIITNPIALDEHTEQVSANAGPAPEQALVHVEPAPQAQITTTPEELVAKPTKYVKWEGWKLLSNDQRKKLEDNIGLEEVKSIRMGKKVKINNNHYAQFSDDLMNSVITNKNRVVRKRGVDNDFVAKPIDAKGYQIELGYINGDENSVMAVSYMLSAIFQKSGIYFTTT